MDLITYWRVVQRQRRIMLIGLGITIALFTLALFRISPSGIQPRSQPVYIARSTMFLTQSGFPLGSIAGGGDPTQMQYAATVYAQLAQSDAVRQAVTHGKGLPWGDSFQVSQRLTSDNQQSLPLIDVAGVSFSSARAVALANSVPVALQRYIAKRQSENRIPDSRRVVLQVIKRPTQAAVLAGRKLTTPIMALLFGLVATLFVAFTVDNVRRQRWLAEVGDVMEETPEPSEQRVHQFASSVEATDDQAITAAKPRRWA